jgi:hypothetical protein
LLNYAIVYKDFAKKEIQMSVYIIDYASVGEKGLKEIQSNAGSDAVFFIYSAEEGKNPVEVQKNNEKKDPVNPVKVSMDVLNKARAAFAKEPAKKQESKSPELQGHADLSESLKKKIRAAVKPVGLRTVQYARLYKAFAESPDKNEYNIALQRSFRVQKKANDIYKLTRSLFEEAKGN